MLAIQNELINSSVRNEMILPLFSDTPYKWLIIVYLGFRACSLYSPFKPSKFKLVFDQEMAK